MEHAHIIPTTILGFNTSIVAIAIVAVAYLLIFTEKVNRAIVAIIGASLMLISHILSQKTAIAGIDFNTIALLVGMMIIVSISERSGLFQYVAIFSAKKVKASPRGLLIVLAIATAVFSAFLDNVTTVLLIVPVTFQITKKLEINPYPYLLIEIFSSNLGGTATLIGDPPNILIGSSIGLGFSDFLLNLTDVVVVAMIALLIFFDILYGRKLTATKETRELVMQMNEKEALNNIPLLVKSLGVLFVVILGFIVAEKIEIANGTIALAGAGVLMLLYTLRFKGHSREEVVEEIFGKVDWTTIFFFVGLFVMVHGLEEVGVLKILGQYLIDLTDGSVTKLAYLILWSSAILSSIIDNIPFVATMIPMLQGIEPSLGGREAMMNVWWALSLGACFGGNGSLIGASANVVVAGLAMRYGASISFLRFLWLSIPVMIGSIVIATAFFYTDLI